MKKVLAAATIISSIFINGCATRPESIPASYVAHERYTMYNCQELREIKNETVLKLQDTMHKQDQSANADAVGVFLVLIPISAFTGDHEADVAKFKGEVQAIETAQAINKCTFSKYSIPTKTIINTSDENKTPLP